MILGKKLGEGAFGTVYRATYAGKEGEDVSTLDCFNLLEQRSVSFVGVLQIVVIWN